MSMGFEHVREGRITIDRIQHLEEILEHSVIQTFHSQTQSSVYVKRNDIQRTIHDSMRRALMAGPGSSLRCHYGRRNGQSTAVAMYVAAYAKAFPGGKIAINCSTPGSGRVTAEYILEQALNLGAVVTMSPFCIFYGDVLGATITFDRNDIRGPCPQGHDLLLGDYWDHIAIAIGSDEPEESLLGYVNKTRGLSYM